MLLRKLDEVLLRRCTLGYACLATTSFVFESLVVKMLHVNVALLWFWFYTCSGCCEHLGDCKCNLH